MTFDKFVSEYLSRGLMQKQKGSAADVEKLLVRSRRHRQKASGSALDISQIIVPGDGIGDVVD